VKTPQQFSTKADCLWVVTVGLLWFSATATAQTLTVLKSFGNLTNISGAMPDSQLVQGLDGTLYGTTSSGYGGAAGTVFKIQPDGSGFAVLKRFTNCVGGWLIQPKNGRSTFPATLTARFRPSSV